MPTREYRSIPVKKDIAEKLSKLDPNRPLKILVAEAIREYIVNRTFSVTYKTPDMTPSSNYVTPGIAPVFTNFNP